MPEPIPRIEQVLTENRYPLWRQLDDGSYAAVVPLAYTTAIITDVGVIGYGNRFCFEDKGRCLAEYEALKSADDEPTGWIARR